MNDSRALNQRARERGDRDKVVSGILITTQGNEKMQAGCRSLSKRKIADHCRRLTVEEIIVQESGPSSEVGHVPLDV
jgi:hypothetical protein